MRTASPPRTENSRSPGPATCTRTRVGGPRARRRLRDAVPREPAATPGPRRAARPRRPEQPIERPRTGVDKGSRALPAIAGRSEHKHPKPTVQRTDVEPRLEPDARARPARAPRPASEEHSGNTGPAPFARQLTDHHRERPSGVAHVSTSSPARTARRSRRGTGRGRSRPAGRWPISRCGGLSPGSAPRARTRRARSRPGETPRDSEPRSTDRSTHGGTHRGGGPGARGERVGARLHSSSSKRASRPPSQDARSRYPWTEASV